MIHRWKTALASVIVLIALGCAEQNSAGGGSPTVGQTGGSGVVAAPQAGNTGATAGTPGTTGVAGVAGLAGSSAAGTGAAGAGTAGAGAAGATGTAGTGGAGGATSTVNCGDTPGTAADAAGCPNGLTCSDPTGTQNYACMCPASPTSLPPCTTGGTECAAYPGSTCQNLFGMMGCHITCTPPGAAPATCPSPLVCVSPLAGLSFCAMSGQILPPTCTVQTDCAAYAGTFCMDPLGTGTLGCVKSCTP